MPEILRFSLREKRPVMARSSLRTPCANGKLGVSENHLVRLLRAARANYFSTYPFAEILCRGLTIFSSCLFASGVLGSVLCLAEDARFWEAYSPGAATCALFHFDASLDDSSSVKNEAQVSGGAALVPEGKFGGALKLSGGGLDIRRANSPQSFVLEFWLKPDTLPEAGKQAVILDRSFKEKEQHWQQLLLMDDGSLLWKNSRRTTPNGGGDNFMLAGPGSIKAGVWQHVALLLGANYDFSELVFINGRGIPGTSGTWRNLPVEPSPGSIRIGCRQSPHDNRESWERVPDETLGKIKYKGEDVFVPYQGLIDELRITEGSLAFVPQPDESFLDPMKKRILCTDKSFLPSDADLLFYASFDETADADMAAGGKKGAIAKDAALVPGVRGKALSLVPKKCDYIQWPSKGSFNASAGTISCWMRVHCPFIWPSNCAISVQRLYFSPYTLGTTNYYFHAPLYPTQELFAPWQWVHAAWVWNRKAAAFYVNGQKVYDVPSNPNFPPPSEDAIGLRAGVASEYDELKIFRRPLNPIEIRNEYLSYLPGTKMEKCGDTGALVVDMRGVNKLMGSAFARAGEMADAKSVELLLSLKDKTVARLELPFQSSPDTPFIWDLPADVGAGDHTISIAFKDTAGKILRTGVQPLKRKDYPWLGAGKYEDEVVLKPFTPIEYKEPSIKVVLEPFKPVEYKTPSIKIVGREMQLGAGGLFDQIKCWGDDLLAGPMRFEIADSKGAAKIKDSGSKTILQKPVKIAWNASSKAVLGNNQEIGIKVEAAMDYDGAAKFAVTYSPVNGTADLKNFSLVIPLASRHAQLFTWNVGAWPGLLKPEERIEVALPWDTCLRQEDGEIFSSLKTYQGAWKDNIVRENVTYRLPTAGNYMPQVWFGSNERGISIFGDNDRGWVPLDDRPAIQVVRKGGEAEIRLNFVSSDYKLEKPRTIVFGIMPTPVKPIPADWRSKEYVGEFGVPFGSGSAYLADDEDRRQNISGLRAVVEMRHKKGEFCMPHINASFWELGNVTRSEFSAEWHDAFNYAPYTMVPPSKTDYIVWTAKRLKKELGIDGFYFDCAGTSPNFNTASGTAYYLDDGRLQPGWTIFSEREMFRRVSQVFGDLYTQNHMWGNGFYGPELSGWQAATVVGEGCEVYTKDSKEFIGRHHIGHGDYWTFFPVEYYSDILPGQFSMERIHAVSHQWGTIRLWQGPNYMWHMSKPDSDPPDLVEKVKKFSRSATGQLIILDTKFALQANSFPKYYRDFVAKPDLKNLPFWDNSKIISCKPGQDNEIYVSAYTSGKEMFLLVSNLSKTKQQVSVQIDCAAAGTDSAAEAIDAEKDATWGANNAETYWKHICDGRPLLSDEEMKFKFEGGAKPKLDLTVGAKDFRAFLLK